MKRISLTRGLSTWVSNSDYSRLRKFSWYALKCRDYFYAARKSRRDAGAQKMVLMHWDILVIKNGDHKNGQTLDNRRCNLRVCSLSQNAANRKRRSDNTSGFKGVSLRYGKWLARIGYKRTRITLGCFLNQIEAARAYDAAALKHFGKFARVNFPKSKTKTNTKIQKLWK